MLATVKQSTNASMVLTMSQRFISTTCARYLKDSSKASANLVNLQSQTPGESITTGNSFKTFAEYRKSAIQHGPLKKSIHSDFKPILTDYKDYGVSDIFAKNARSNDYRE